MDDFLRQQIRSARDSRARKAVAARVTGACWPAGVADHAEPVAAGWLKQWWPERLGATLPACSCRSGHCPVCN